MRFLNVFLFLISNFALADDLTKVNDAVAINARQDGKYDVYCSSGKTEVATAVDLALDNVCPQIKSVPNFGIVSIQRRDDGKFDVVCQDLSKKIVTKEDIVGGTACVNKGKGKFALREGEYIPESTDPYFCPSYKLSKAKPDNNNNIAEFDLTCTSGDTWSFKCELENCVGDNRKIKITDGQDNHFYYTSGSSSTELKIK